MKFETKLNKLGIDENEVKSIIMNCECGEINGAYFIDLTKEKKEFIMEIVGNYLDDDSEEFEGWTDIKRISTFCKTFDISEDEIPNYYRLGFNEGGCDIAYTLESNKDVLLVLTDDERYTNSFISTLSQTEETVDDDFEEIRVDFKIISNKNENIYCEGYVEINDEEAEDVDWYYYDAQGFATPHMFIEHTEVDGFKGATPKQEMEIEQFKTDYLDDSLWIDTCILQSTEDENQTFIRENCTLIINDGACVESKKVIEVTITDFEKGEAVLVDEHPIVNDKDYCEVVETVSRIHYSWDGCHFLHRGKSKDDSKEELIEAIIPKVILGCWMEENQYNEFTDYGIEPPVVYDWEEDSYYKVNSIDNFVNNCKEEECYLDLMQQLQKVAESEYTVNIIDKEK